MSIGREDYQERKEARIDRMEERAARAQAESDAASHAAFAIMEHIPPGQPILVGHHSERHHRRDLDKIDRNMRKSIEAGEKSAYYASRAASAASNTAISSDDPDAVEKLEAKLAALQSLQAIMKAVNAYYRKHKTLDGCPDLTPETRQSIETSWARGWYVGIPFPPYELSNNNSNIKRIRDRLAQLRKVDEMEHTEIEFDGGTIITNEAMNRVQILFDEKPDEATRSKLKGYGFRWSRTEGAWQTQRTPQSLRRACYLLGIDPPKPAPATTAEDSAAQDAAPLETVDESQSIEEIQKHKTEVNTMKKICSHFSSALTKALKKANSIVCQVSGTDIYVSNGFFAVKLTNSEYNELVRPVVNCDAGNWQTKDGSAVPCSIDIICAMDRAIKEADHFMEHAPMEFDTQTGKRFNPKMTGYYSKNGDFVSLFDVQYNSIVSQDLPHKCKNPISPMVVFDGDNAIAIILPIRPDVYSQPVKAIRSYFGDDLDGQNADFLKSRIEILEREKEELRIERDNALIERDAAQQEAKEAEKTPVKEKTSALDKYPIYFSIPDSWKVLEGALTAPSGYVWITNGKSRFCGEYKQALYKLPENQEEKEQQQEDPALSALSDSPVEVVDIEEVKESMDFMPGDIVKIEGAYTKRHNGLYVVTNVISNGQYWLHKVNKSGELSLSNYSTCRWPLSYYSYNRERNAAAKEWDIEHATLSSATVKDIGGVIEYFRKNALECLERANNCTRLYGADSTEVHDNMTAFESYKAIVDRLGGTIEEDQRGADEQQYTAQESSGTRSIKFYYNGIKLNGRRELIKCSYSIDNSPCGQECVTVYAKDFGTVLPRDLFNVENDTDSKTDYFETDSTDIFPPHPLYPYVRAAALSAQLKGRVKHVAYLEDKIATSRCSDMYREELAEYSARMDKYAAELSTLPKGQPTEKDIVAAVHAMRLEAENKYKAEEQAKEQAQQEKNLTERENGRQYIDSVSAEYPIKDGDPVVTIEWSENPAFYSWKDGELKLSVAAAEIVLRHFDEERHNENKKSGKGGYDKTKFVIEYTNESGEPSTYEGRYDLGDNDGGLIAHIRAFGEFLGRSANIIALADLLESYTTTAGGNVVSVSLAPWVEQKLDEVKQETETDNESALDLAENVLDLAEMLTDEQLIMGVYSSDDLDLARFFLQQLAKRDQKKALEVFRAWRDGEPMDI